MSVAERAQAVIDALAECAPALYLRDRAIATIVAAAQTPEGLAEAQEAAMYFCAEAAVAVLEECPSLRQLVTDGGLGTYLFRQACILATGAEGWAIDLELRPPQN